MGEKLSVEEGPPPEPLKLRSRSSNKKIKIKVGSDEDMNIHKICLNGYELEKFLAGGTFGAVYKSCNPDGDCNYVVKIQDLNNSDRKIEWENEVETTKLLNSYNIGSKYIGAWFCDEDKIGIIVSELWSGSLASAKNIAPCLSKKLINKLTDEIKIINDLGLVHGDILPKNVLVKKNHSGKIIDATVTDFGSVQSIEQWKKDQYSVDWINKIYRYHLDDPNLILFYKDSGVRLQDIIKDPTLLDKPLIYYLRNCKK